jgi:hypothetical protein
MRARGLATAAAAPVAAVAAVGIALACAACGHPAARPLAGRPAATQSPAPCWQTAVRMIERHVVVRSVPPACAGLSQAQLNHVVASAIRAAAGPHPKAVQRRIAAADARYLGNLVRTGPPPRPSSSPPSWARAGGAPLRPGPAARLSLSLVLAALGCWAATAAVGGYLLARRRRPGARSGKIPAIAAGHAGVAVGGLAVWAALAATRGSGGSARGSDALAWIAGALLIAAAGLGLAVLLASPPELTSTATLAARPQSTGAGSPAPRRVLVIAAHAVLAVVTILLVLLAATGGG